MSVPFLLAGGDPTWVPREPLRVEYVASHNPDPRERAVRYAFEGEELTLTEIAARTGVSRDRLKHRVRTLGWDIARAVRTPKRVVYWSPS